MPWISTYDPLTSRWVVIPFGLLQRQSPSQSFCIRQVSVPRTNSAWCRGFCCLRDKCSESDEGKEKEGELDHIESAEWPIFEVASPDQGRIWRAGGKTAPRVLQGIKKVILPLGRNSKWDKWASRLGFPGFREWQWVFWFKWCRLWVYGRGKDRRVLKKK